jgi:hypothetical protein
MDKVAVLYFSLHVKDLTVRISLGFLARGQD